MDLLALTIAVSLALPNWLLLVLLVPTLMLLSFVEIVPPLFSIGSADVRVFDAILILVTLRATVSTLLRRGSIPIDRTHVATIGLVLVFLLSSLSAYFLIDDNLLADEIVALARFISQAAVLVLLTLSITRESEIRQAIRVLDWLGYLIAGSVYAGIFFFMFGLKVGEVHSTATAIRTFGPLGDQVGFVLLFFVVRQWILGRALSTLFLASAIVVTGTRGALVALAICLAVLWWNRGLVSRETPMSPWPFIIVLVSAVVFVAIDAGGTRSRSLLEQGPQFNSFMQRLQTGQVALNVIEDHPLLGVGYSGFRLVAREYGADTAFSQFWSPSFIATTSNQYLQVLTDAGILGLVMFCIFLLTALGNLRQTALIMQADVQHFIFAGYIWLLALALGNHSAAWMLPGSLISYLLWLLLAMSVACKWRTGSVLRPA